MANGFSWTKTGMDFDSIAFNQIGLMFLFHNASQIITACHSDRSNSQGWWDTWRVRCFMGNLCLFFGWRCPKLHRWRSQCAWSMPGVSPPEGINRWSGEVEYMEVPMIHCNDEGLLQLTLGVHNLANFIQFQLDQLGLVESHVQPTPEALSASGG